MAKLANSRALRQAEAVPARPPGDDERRRVMEPGVRLHQTGVVLPRFDRADSQEEARSEPGRHVGGGQLQRGGSKRHDLDACSQVRLLRSSWPWGESTSSTSRPTPGRRSRLRKAVKAGPGVAKSRPESSIAAVTIPTRGRQQAVRSTPKRTLGILAGGAIR